MAAALLSARYLPLAPAVPNDATTSLRALPRGLRARVVDVGQAGEVGERLMEMGLVAGTEIEVLAPSRWGGALRLGVRGYVLSLRAQDAQYVQVLPLR